jgi:hypothetical protein
MLHSGDRLDNQRLSVISVAYLYGIGRLSIRYPVAYLYGIVVLEVPKFSTAPSPESLHDQGKRTFDTPPSTVTCVSH